MPTIETDQPRRFHIILKQGETVEITAQKVHRSDDANRPNDVKSYYYFWVMNGEIVAEFHMDSVQGWITK